MRCCENTISIIAYWLLIITTLLLCFYCFRAVFNWQALDSPFNFISLVISLGFIALIGAINKYNNKE